MSLKATQPANPATGYYEDMLRRANLSGERDGDADEPSNDVGRKLRRRRTEKKRGAGGSNHDLHFWLDDDDGAFGPDESPEKRKNDR
jgi:hypothetical protein